MSLLLALLIVSLSASAAPLSLGPEMPLTAPAVEPAPFTRGGPRVASNGRDFLAVWWDGRSGNHTHGIRAARIDRDGRLLDVTGIAVAARSGFWTSVASDGRDYLVSYDCAPGELVPVTCLARVDAETGRITSRNKIDRAANATLASNGRNYLLTYTSINPRGAGHLDLHGAIVSRDATTIGQPFRLAGRTENGAAAVSNGDVYFVGWSLFRNLTGAIVSGDGAVTPTATISTLVPAWGPAVFSWSVASDGEDFFVVWQQNLRVVGQRYETDLRARKVSPSGERGPERTLLEPGPETTWNVRASWNGSRYLIAYTASVSPATAPAPSSDAAADVRAITASADGELAAPPSTLAERSGREVTGATASNDLGTLVVWEHARRGNAIQIEARLVNRSGEPESERIALSHSVTWQQSLAGSADTLAWEEFAGEEQRRKVFVQRIGAEGRATAVESSTREQLHPAVGGAIVAWLQQDLNTTGHAEVVVKQLADLASPPLLLARAPRESRVAIASTSTTHLVAWESESHQILGARFNADGTLIDSSAIEISSGPRPQSRPIIGTDGSRFLVVWSMEEPLEACAGYCDTPLSLHAAVVTTS
ncbi:MAG TPA: hypothetical protein VHL59_11635, partial [Thermoanaerobaculia bacterium]|nr:hypothetical protein [Thermoanaerobaculia bacterium]